MSKDKEDCSSKEFEWALGLNRLSLRVLGLWPSDTQAKSMALRRSLVVPLMILIMVFGLLLPEFYAFTVVISEFQLAIDNVVTLGPTFTSCLKLYFMWKHHQVLQPVVISATDDWLGPRASWQLQIMRSHAASARLVTIVDSTILLLCYLGYILSSFFNFDIRIVNNITDYGDRYLMLQSYYPFDYSKSPVFELAMFFQQLSAFFLGIAITVPDDYFVALVLHASAQYQILGAQIQRAVKQHNAQPRLLANLIDRHVHLHRMVRLIEQSFSFVVAAQIFCMCSAVCCLGFETREMLNYKEGSSKPALLQVLTLACSLCTMLLRTLVDCAASESLASSSEQVFFSIRGSDWYTIPPRNLRCLIPMLIMSQYPRQIKAGKLLPMSMETYCNIIKNIAGYMSVLITVSHG